MYFCDFFYEVHKFQRVLFSASPEDPAQELTTEEMRKLIERNEIVPTGTGLKPYNTVNV